MFKRELESEINILKNEFPVIAILGPRQSGKTTLSLNIFPDYHYVSLEDIDQREFAQNDPRGFLNEFPENVIFDEIQRVPSLMSYLQTHADKIKKNGSIVITGSHNFLLNEQISQSLAGRVGISKLMPFTYNEIRQLVPELDEILFKGFYPRIFDQNIRPEVYYKNYVATYIEKDIRQMKNIINLDTFTKFMKILAGRTGQEMNLSVIGDECGISHATVKEWISLLEASYLIFKVRPFYKNYNKRLIKNFKIYFTDTGLACSLLGIRKKEDLKYHYLKGNLFETFIAGEFFKYNLNSGERFDLYFWRDNHQRELDLIADSGNSQFAVEIKSGSTIQEKYFSGLQYWQSLTGDNPSSSYLVYGGKENIVRNKMNVVGWRDLKEKIVKNIIK